LPHHHFAKLRTQCTGQAAGTLLLFPAGGKNIHNAIDILFVTFQQQIDLYFHSLHDIAGAHKMVAHRTRIRLYIAAALLAAIGAGADLVPGARAQTAPDYAAPDYAALLAAPDRSDADRAADKRRDPAPFLAFAAPRPGMKVLDMGAGGGYSSELMARAVAPNGVVFAQNPAYLGDRAKAAFAARMATPAMKNAVAETAPFDNPIPAGVSDLDLITFLFYYHDTTYMTVDRAQMNRKLFAALKPGGFFVIADHSALPGQGVSVGKTLHRIEEATLRQEVEAAGFKLVATGDFWRDAADTHDFPSFKRDMPVDNFVLKFQKP
jgi:predicted methyltransferase